MISLGIIAIVSMPIILFVLINTFDLPEITLPFLTIPRTVQNRYETLTTMFSENFLMNSLKNFTVSLIMLITQNDQLPWNSINGYGIIYLWTIPLTIMGIIAKIFQNKKEEETIIDMIMKVWLIVSTALLFIVEPNINRCNIIIIPIIYYTIIGLYEVVNNSKITAIIISVISLMSFIAFGISYINIDWNEYHVFENKIEDTIKYVESLDVDNVYFSYSIKEPYIYVLFYTQEDPNLYVETVKYKNEEGTFENVLEFGKYKFYLPKEFENDGNSAYVIPIENDLELNYDEWKTTYFDRFIVLESKR